MKRRAIVRRIALCVAILSLAGGCSPGSEYSERVPAGYDLSYAKLIEGGTKEGRLVIWSTTDRQVMRDLLSAFQRAYPGIKTEYHDLPARDVGDRFLAIGKTGGVNPDLLLSSSMDMQIKLVNDGYAQSYDSPEKDNLPDWANWKNQAWGVTAEPVVMVYNKTLLSPDRIPKNHMEFVRLLERRDADLRGRVATYHPALSSVGYLCLSQDNAISGHVWQMAHGLGANRARFFSTSEEVLKEVSSGRAVIGYNVLGSYALDEATHNKDLGVVFPADYTLVMSRIAMIPNKARHPNAARLFLDFLLSVKGQQLLTDHAMPSVRSDVERPLKLRDTTAPMRAVRVGPELLIVQDRLTRNRFMKRWDREVEAGAASSKETAR
ncbi:MAG: ABC transporter substrate-binding protein [Sphingopyxis sp.]|nr:ABC transporter substrate-binding protein [Sphingopyxis sp.]